MKNWHIINKTFTLPTKLLFTVALLCAAQAIGQTDDIKKTQDPYTKEVKLTTGFFAIKNATVTIDATKTEIDIFFVLPENCFAEGCLVELYFQNSKAKTTLKNTGTLNCNGYFHLTYKNSHSLTTYLKKLSEQPVVQFLFLTNSKKQVILSPTSDEQLRFTQKLQLLIKEAKKLLPPQP